VPEVFVLQAAPKTITTAMTDAHPAILDFFFTGRPPSTIPA
jgi:hypothetical protein